MNFDDNIKADEIINLLKSNKNKEIKMNQIQIFQKAQCC